MSEADKLGIDLDSPIDPLAPRHYPSFDNCNDSATATAVRFRERGKKMRISAAEIRTGFIEFFRQKHHQVIASAPVIPKDDPTLLYINSGMAPLKNVFLGLEPPLAPRMVNVQPCIRTNDIDDVGDRHHLTMFEMMGSWSVGDYWKEAAAAYAWEFLTLSLGIPPHKLYVTVYAGSTDRGIQADTETRAAWLSLGLPDDRIVDLGEDNFWGPAGLSGPCGPCTEIFYDTGEEHGPGYSPGADFDTKGRYIEIWNAGVFMELNQQEMGGLTPLPLRSVDTGSGLERMEMVLRGLDSVYETTALAPLVSAAEATFACPRLSEGDYRVLADHIRTCAFLLAEGMRPGNEGRAYIPRKLIRRSVAVVARRGYSQPDFSELARLTISHYKNWYPHLEARRDAIVAQLQKEVSGFIKVLDRGRRLVQQHVEKRNTGALAAEFLFQAATVRGIPIDVMEDLAHQNGLSCDREGFESHMRSHRETSRRAPKKVLAGASASSQPSNGEG